VMAGVASAAGLLASMLHLGQPLRAWRAFSQWRSSWLSREGVAAVLTFVPLACAFALVARADEGVALRVAGAALALFAGVTLFCTANIYRSLKTVRAWYNGFVWPGYLVFGLASGGAVLASIAAYTPSDGFPPRTPLVLAVLTACAASLCAALKWRYWLWLDGAPPRSDTGTATGLGRFGTVRPAEAPHTEENYLTQEMGFRLARKHARRLRASVGQLLAVGSFLLLIDAIAPLPPWLRGLACVGAVSFVLAATFVERWLFFAEAKHVVMLYYRAGAERG